MQSSQWYLSWVHNINVSIIVNVWLIKIIIRRLIARVCAFNHSNVRWDVTGMWNMVVDIHARVHGIQTSDPLFPLVSFTPSHLLLGSPLTTEPPAIKSIYYYHVNQTEPLYNSLNHLAKWTTVIILQQQHPRQLVLTSRRVKIQAPARQHQSRNREAGWDQN